MTNNIVASDIIPLVSNTVDVFDTSNIKNDEIVGKTNTVFDLHLMAIFKRIYQKSIYQNLAHMVREDSGTKWALLTELTSLKVFSE